MKLSRGRSRSLNQGLANTNLLCLTHFDETHCVLAKLYQKENRSLGFVTISIADPRCTNRANVDGIVND